MKTLLIWDWFGEADLSLYVIEDAPEWLTECHRQFINAMGTSEEVDELLMRVHDAICENPDHFCNKDDELAGKWAPLKIDTSGGVIVSLVGPFRVVISGFVP